MEPAKEFTIADDKGPQEVIISQKEGVFLSSAYCQVNQKRHKLFGKSTFLLQSKSGQLLVMASERQVVVYSVKEESVIAEKQLNFIYSISLSPDQSFLQVLDKVSVDIGKTILYSFPSLVEKAVYKEDQSTNYFLRNTFPLVRFSSDGSRYFRYNNKIIEVYDREHKKVEDIESGPLQFFDVSKTSKGEKYFIVVIYLNKKTNEGVCNIFTEKSTKQPIYNKNIKKAEQIKIRFSPNSNQFLMELQTYFDPSGKSYYGQFGLFIYNDVKNKISSIKTENGPVHDFSWHSNGDRFIVISGFMPAAIKMFNRENEPVHDFGKKHRNTIVWGNLGRFLCLAGFGNLNGQMDMWDLQTMKQIGYCKSSSASYCQWSLDDRKIITAIVTPRLRVDNCYKIYSYTGTQLKKIGYQQTELYGVNWLKIPNFEAVPRALSPGRKVQIQPKKQEGKFKTFASAMNFGSMAFEQKQQEREKPKLVPGQFPDQQVHKKKRRKKNKDVETLGPS